MRDGTREDTTVSVQIEEIKRAIRTLPFVTKLSPVRVLPFVTKLSPVR